VSRQRLRKIPRYRASKSNARNAARTRPSFSSLSSARLSLAWPSTTYVVAAALSHALRITTVLEYSTCMHWAGVRRYDRNGEALWKIVFPIPMGNVALAYLSATPSLHALHKTPENASCPLCVRQTCIGASDRIFDHCFCLSSAATTPLTLEPMGSPALLTKTQALSSNLTTLPSGRCHFFAVRTTTA